MRRSQMKRYYLKRRTPQKNSEGGTIVAYADAVEINAIIWPAGGKVQAEMYGERLAYIKNMEYGGDEMMQEGDGICVFVSSDDKPDYKIISIQTEYNPKRIELEKL